MKKFVCCLVSAFLVFGSFPAVQAEESTYNIANSVFNFELYFPHNQRTYCYDTVIDQECRIVVGISNSTNDYFAIAYSTFNFGFGTSSDYNQWCPRNPNLGSNQGSFQYNNQTIYYAWITSGSGSSKPTLVTSDVNIISDFYGSPSQNQANAQYYCSYAFGSNAVDPAPPAPVFGDLANVGYNTKIAGSGQAAINNLDTVSWNPETDTSGNDISDMSVSIRVVPGKYSASSRQSLAEKLYSDFVLNTLDATVLDTIPASSGSFSVTWSDVIDELSIPFATISSLVDQDGTFIKNGWIYQVRLEGENYEGEWQTVYTATSSGVQNDLTIIQSTTINQTLVNTITEINHLNSTSNNWYINETTINMSDYSEPSQGNKPWWAYLLEAIVSLINKLVDGISSIIGAVADLVGDIIDGILGLFTFDSFSVPDFSTHQQNIHDNSGIFGESIDILQTMNQTISNADSSAEPILYYPGIDLEGVEFIPEITINLNDYVEDLGLTQWHNLAYTCTDIFIWTTLIYTIYRKLIGVFKK